MLINKGFKYRIYPTEEQKQQLKQIAGNNRFVWNQFLEFTNINKKLNNQYFSRTELQNYLVYLKDEFPFLKDSYSQSLQYQAYLLDKTLKRTFDKDTTQQRQRAIAKAHEEPNEEWKNIRLAKAYHYGFPKFKKKSNFTDTIHYPQHFKIEKNYIDIPKFGLIRFKQHRPLEGIPKNITISQNGNQWFVSICCELEIKEKEIKTDNVVGLDLGVKEFAVFSDGTIIKNPKFYRKAENKIKREQRKLSRRQSGSKRYNRQQMKVHKLYGQSKNRRKDFLHKLTHHMIIKYDGFILEDLASKNMMKNHKLAKSIQDVSWSEFARILEYKSQWNFKYFEKIDRFAPSSQICYQCGNKQEMPLEKRTYNCNSCGHIMDRDLNASLNIKAFSKIYTTGTVEIYGQGETSIEDSLNCQKRQLETIGSPCL